MSSGLSFHVVENVSEAEADGLLQQTDFPTVWCLEFMRSMASEQHYPVMFHVEKSGVLVALALGMFRSRFLLSDLILPSLPRFLEDDPAIKALFWHGLADFCRKHAVTRTFLNSYEAPAAQLPELSGLIRKKERREFYIDLTRSQDELLKSFSSSHRRNIKKAQKHDLVVSVSEKAGCLEEHVIAFTHTANRRQSRNETIPGIDEELLVNLLNSQSAIVMQVHKDDHIVCSMYIILTPKSAFYFSGGTSPEGSRIGAFHYLIWNAILELQERGITSLTLGGTDAETPEGLRRFKLGFDAREVVLTNNQYILGIWPLTMLARLKHGLRHSPRDTLRAIVTAPRNLCAHVLTCTRWELYSTAAQLDTLSPDLEPDLLLRQLTQSDFEKMSQVGGRLADQASMFFYGRGIASAYGLFVRGELAHVSWVYTSEDYDREPAVQLQLEPGEAEITNCYTQQAFRGQHIYPYAIARICNLLLAQGKRRIYMKVSKSNEASKRGITRAGFSRDGTALLLESAMISRWQGFSIKLGSS